MAKTVDVILESDTWTELTDNDVSVITFQNKTGKNVLIKVGTDNTVPVNDGGSLVYPRFTGELKVNLADLAPGTQGGVRVFAKSLGVGKSTLMVSHA